MSPEPQQQQPAQPDGAPTPSRRRWPVIIVCIVVIVACLVGAGFGIATMLQQSERIQDVQNEQGKTPATPDDLAASSSSQGALADNPIDFASLQKQNPDIYAWVYVPGTNVNHAVLRREGDNAYYLAHDESLQENEAGAIFTEDYNTKDFQDAVTMVYGHDMAGGLMFSTLHEFEDQGFFDQNDTFYIYTPGHIYTYRIASAYTTSDDHVLYRNGYFQTFDQLRAFEQEIADPHSIQQCTRDVKMDDSSKIVVLSTCNTGAPDQYARYLVCGVRIDDSATK